MKDLLMVDTPTMCPSSPAAEGQEGSPIISEGHMLFERVEQGYWAVEWLGKGRWDRRSRRASWKQQGLQKRQVLSPRLSFLKPSWKFGFCFKIGAHWKLPDDRLPALLASEQRFLPLLLHPCARSLELPSRMGSAARLSAEPRFASVLRNQLTGEFRKLLNKRI